MPGWRDPPLIPRDRPCGAVSRGDPQSNAETGYASSEPHSTNLVISISLRGRSEVIAEVKSHRTNGSPGVSPLQSDLSLLISLLSESAGDVVFRPFVGRIGEYFFRLIELDHLAQQEKPGELGHAGRLLHIMRHNHDGVLLF